VDAGALAALAAERGRGLLVVGAIDDELTGSLDLVGVDYGVARLGIDPAAFVEVATAAIAGADPRGGITVQPVYLRKPV
jgi:hypothetical protein